MSLVLLNGVSCSSSNGSSPPPPINCIAGTGENVTISGKATFDLVPFNVSGTGLDYSNISSIPVKGAVVELVCGGVIATATTNADGDYSLDVPSGSIDLFVRVKAQMKQAGTASWDFTVVDNTRSKALYAMDSSLFDANADLSLYLHADSGWGTTSYTGTRVAGPFAILDSVYHAYNKVLTADSDAVFPPLKLNWSVNNVLSEKFIPTIGQIRTSLFDGTEIYILGKENSDTDEYDDHVIIHEWGHYFETFFSRSDSIGGPHGYGDLLDIRLAFGEGWGNAFSGMVTNDPLYRDSGGFAQSLDGTFDVESNTCVNPGWFSECSVQAILYDLYDLTNDGADTVNLGFLPIYSILTNEQKNTTAVTSIFSFIDALKIASPGDNIAIDTLVTDQGISSIINEYGDSELNDPGNPLPNPDFYISVIPVHDSLTVNAGTVNVCSTDQFHIPGYADADRNRLGVHRFVRFNNSVKQNISISVIDRFRTGDPVIMLFKQGVFMGWRDAEAITGSEILNINSLGAGDYVIQVSDYGNMGFSDALNLPGNYCYEVSVTAP